MKRPVDRVRKDGTNHHPIWDEKRQMLIIWLRWIFICKRSLKIPKGKSGFVYRGRTDNTMAKRKVQKDKQ
jgi:hypothetical protein